MDGTVLIADDDRTIRTVLTQALGRAGCKVHATGSLSQLLKWVEEGRGDLVITDVMMPDGNGIDQISKLHQTRPGLPVIVISAQNTIVTAIRATEAAAFEYLPKPFDLPDLMRKAGEALARRTNKPAIDSAEQPPFDRADPSMPLIGHSPAMQALFKLVARLLNVDLPIMISGEAGVGKSTLARSVHGLSTRSSKTLVVLTSVDASEQTTARLFDRTDVGTILIEDSAGFDKFAQARLIGLIESYEANRSPLEAPRFVATCGPDVQADVDAGRLRADLLYRLAGVTIEVPPLRSRIDDVVPLAEHLLARAALHGLPERSLDAEAAAVLRQHHFPGNVRELENLMRLLALTGATPRINATEMRDLFQERGHSLAAPQPQISASRQGGQPQSPTAAGTGTLSEVIEAHLQRYFDLHAGELPPPGVYGRILREMEVPLLQVALDATGGNQLKCADLLGINRNTLRKKLGELNIDVTRRRKLM